VSALDDRVVAAIGDHYQLEGELGRGGTAVVYRARDTRLNRLVAIKVLPPELAHDPAIRTRFAREAHTSAQLSHAHIVPIFDVGEREGIAFLVMGFVTGGSLARLLAHEPRQPIDEARRLLGEIADALAYAHVRGVIHRDIKPDNILLDADSGRAMVTDFGIARALEAGSRLTVTGVAVGTPTYMSPEQAVGDRAIDGRSDIYSLGVVAYQMLTGRVPFTAGNSMALLMKHVSEPPRPIAELRPDTPRPLREAVERALAKAPEDRWPTAAAMREALRSDEAPIAWRPEPREAVRYTSPRDGVRRVSRDGGGGGRTVSPRRGSPAAEPRAGLPAPRHGALPLEPEHLATLTPEQRKDLRLWHGRVNLTDRIKAVRWYTPFMLGMWILGMAGFAGGFERIPPLILSPLVPAWITVKWWRRLRSLRDSGVKRSRVLFMPLARWVLPAPAPDPTELLLLKLAPRDVIESTAGVPIRRAVDERAAILDIVARLPKQDRALLPDVAPTADALVERIAHLTQALIRLDDSVDPRLRQRLDERIAEVEKDPAAPEAQRRIELLQRQRATLDDLDQRRAMLVRQLESAGLALENIRLDLIKLRSSGLQAALSDVSMATQEARALSREIGAVLDAAAEVRGL
jgi:serine/threonine-protein kinase